MVTSWKVRLQRADLEEKRTVGSMRGREPGSQRKEQEKERVKGCAGDCTKKNNLFPKIIGWEKKKG